MYSITQILLPGAKTTCIPSFWRSGIVRVGTEKGILTHRPRDWGQKIGGVKLYGVALCIRIFILRCAQLVLHVVWSSIYTDDRLSKPSPNYSPVHSHRVQLTSSLICSLAGISRNYTYDYGVGNLLHLMLTLQIGLWLDRGLES